MSDIDESCHQSREQLDGWLEEGIETTKTKASDGAMEAQITTSLAGQALGIGDDQYGLTDRLVAGMTMAWI